MNLNYINFLCSFIILNSWSQDNIKDRKQAVESVEVQGGIRQGVMYNRDLSAQTPWLGARDQQPSSGLSGKIAIKTKWGQASFEDESFQNLSVPHDSPYRNQQEMKFFVVKSKDFFLKNVKLKNIKIGEIKTGVSGMWRQEENKYLGYYDIEVDPKTLPEGMRVNDNYINIVPEIKFESEKISSCMLLHKEDALLNLEAFVNVSLIPIAASYFVRNKGTSGKVDNLTPMAVGEKFTIGVAMKYKDKTTLRIFYGQAMLFGLSKDKVNTTQLNARFVLEQKINERNTLTLSFENNKWLHENNFTGAKDAIFVVSNPMRLGWLYTFGEKKAK